MPVILGDGTLFLTASAKNNYCISRTKKPIRTEWWNRGMK